MVPVSPDVKNPRNSTSELTLESADHYPSGKELGLAVALAILRAVLAKASF